MGAALVRVTGGCAWGLLVGSLLVGALGCGDDDDDSGGDGDADADGDGDGDGDGDLDIDGYVGSLPAWPEPPEPEDATTDLGVMEREKDAAPGADEELLRFSCQRTQHDVTTRHQDILNLGGTQTALKPGLLLQGDAFAHGVLQTVPMPRAPLTISIDLPVADPSVDIEVPTSASIQDAVASLQVQATEVATDLPALVSYNRQEVESSSELSLAVGLHAAYESPLFEVDFDSSFEGATTERKFTLVATLYQPMYTISFADDGLPLASDFFADSVTIDDVLAQQDAGTIGPDNLPVFVSSVTYGRMVIFTATSYEAENSLQISAALDASFGDWQGGAELDAETQSFLSSLEIQVLAIGGDSAGVSNAIVTGDYNSLFDNPDATSALPLRFVVRNLAGTRSIAVLGDATQYVEEQCTATSGWLDVPGPEGITFDSISAGHGGDVWAVGDGDAYHFDGAQMVLEAVHGNLIEVAVDDDGALFGVDDSGRPLRWDGADWEVGAGGVLALDVGDGRLACIDLSSGMQYLDVADFGGAWTPLDPFATAAQISVASSTTMWLTGGQFGLPNVRTYTITMPGGVVVEQSTEPSVIMTAAASEAEIWALTDDHRIAQWNETNDAWDLDVVPPPPDPITFLDAGPGGQLWVLNGSGNVIRYEP